jgi:hypothetical protein
MPLVLLSAVVSSLGCRREVAASPSQPGEPVAVEPPAVADTGPIVFTWDTGYIHEGVAQRSNIREFVLIKHIGCRFGAEGQPQHVIMVDLQDKLRATLTAQAVTIAGIFAVEPYVGPDGRTWALYKLAGTSFEVNQP